MATALPLETQTLLAELLEHLIGVRAQRSMVELTGSLVEKTIKGESYLYWQASLPGGRTRQFYLGRRMPALERVVRRLDRERESLAPDLERVQRLAAQVRAGGANVADRASGRVVRALAESGLFDAGAVLVGTHAFAVLGNLLGVRWASGALRTQDVDVPSSRNGDIDVAVPDTDADVPTILEGLEMGFLPVRRSTREKRRPPSRFAARRCGSISSVRNGGIRMGRCFIRRFGAAAQPLAYLDYLLEEPERALFVDGGATMVNVPAPARFAFHKLLVAPLRPAAFQTKAAKDVVQAAEVLDLLIEVRPGDLRPAWESLRRGGRNRAAAATRGMSLLRSRQPAIHARLAAIVGPSR